MPNFPVGTIVNSLGWLALSQAKRYMVNVLAMASAFGLVYGVEQYIFSQIFSVEPKQPKGIAFVRVTPNDRHRAGGLIKRRQFRQGAVTNDQRDHMIRCERPFFGQ
jgi:hypothetical protein